MARASRLSRRGALLVGEQARGADRFIAAQPWTPRFRRGKGSESIDSVSVPFGRKLTEQTRIALASSRHSAAALPVRARPARSLGLARRVESIDANRRARSKQLSSRARFRWRRDTGRLGAARGWLERRVNRGNEDSFIEKSPRLFPDWPACLSLSIGVHTRDAEANKCHRDVNLRAE